jgi:hypothetical protein
MANADAGRSVFFCSSGAPHRSGLSDSPRRKEERQSAVRDRTGGKADRSMKENALNSTLIIPVEEQSREFDAKLLLACVAAERGYPAVLGSRRAIHLSATRLPRGIYSFPIPTIYTSKDAPPQRRLL